MGADRRATTGTTPSRRTVDAQTGAATSGSSSSCTAPPSASPRIREMRVEQPGHRLDRAAAPVVVAATRWTRRSCIASSPRPRACCATSTTGPPTRASLLDPRLHAPGGAWTGWRASSGLVLDRRWSLAARRELVAAGLRPLPLARHPGRPRADAGPLPRAARSTSSRTGGCAGWAAPTLGPTRRAGAGRPSWPRPVERSSHSAPSSSAGRCPGDRHDRVLRQRHRPPVHRHHARPVECRAARRRDVDHRGAQASPHAGRPLRARRRHADRAVLRSSSPRSSGWRPGWGPEIVGQVLLGHRRRRRHRPTSPPGSVTRRSGG